MSSKTQNNLELDSAACPSCSSKQIADRWPTRRITGNKSILWCRSCGLGWQHPLPSVADIRKYYDRFPTYNIHGTNEKEQGFQRRIRRIDKLLPQSGRLLDIGSGLGTFLKLALKDGWQATGIEPQESAAQYCQQHLGIEPYVQPIDDIDLSPQLFDVVSVWDVWEHIHSPIDFIERCIDLLVPNGLLALSIPNASGYPARIFRGNWRYVMYTHLSYFTLAYVHRIMTERNMHFQWADHTIKAQSLLQGVVSWLPIHLNTERIIRLGRHHNSAVKLDQKRQLEIHSKKEANSSVLLSWIRRLVLKGNLHPLPFSKGDMMDLYFKKGPEMQNPKI
jgi:2-polyprenyl-3-methyl-5-hydroxy-6-metoxy-1,4-benzoquinol methylase